MVIWIKAPTEAKRRDGIHSALAYSALLLMAATGSRAQSAEVHQASFGTLPDGRPVPAVTLTNGHGISATVIAYGASLQALRMPDRRGKVEDVALGYPRLQDYLDKPQYFGATVGRVANRIAKGRFILDGREYQTPVNNGPNALHGGTQGFDKVLWTVVDTGHDAAGAHVTLRYVSPAGDQDYPGTLTVTASYRLDEKNALTIDYRATTDATTVVNISNHAYWNLAGEGAPAGAMRHLLTIPADAYLPVDDTLIPTGEIRAVQGGPFDFRRATAIGDRVRQASDEQIVFGRGYDHNWIVARAVTPGLHLMARVSEPVSGREFELWSDQPGLQFYSGNFLDGTSAGKSGRIYRQGDAFCLEPQTFPDGVNRPAFPSARLEPGKEYRNRIVYRFTVAPR